ncbi:MAG: MATE family efflux transporter [Chitinophagaceae bacterium]|nr:MAG: MATE family efflux transporter [Chitinophagaceae bacterium]
MDRQDAYSETRQTWALSLPIIFGELSQMALHLIDTAMVGALGYKQLAAAALVLAVMNIPFVLGIGMTISVSQLVSLSHGRKDGQKVSHYFYNGFWICAITALVISVGLEFGKNILFHLGQDPEVAAMAVPFLQIMGWSIIPMLLFMSLKQFTDGLEKTRTAMIISIAALPLNIFINWLLIYGNWGLPRLELVGAGWGTFITRSLMFLTLGLVILKHPLFKRYIAVRRSQWKLNKQSIRELLHIGVPSSLQIGLEGGAFAISGIIVGTIGATEQASHQIALTCASFTFMVSMGLAQGASIRVSNAYGTLNGKKIITIGKTTLISALLYGVVCAILFAVFRNILPTFFNDNAQVLAMAPVLLLFAAVFQISDATQATGAGLLRGIKDVRIPTILVAVAYWVIGIPAGYVLAFHYQLGAAGIWIGFIVGLTCSSVFLCWRFLNMAKKI